MANLSRPRLPLSYLTSHLFQVQGLVTATFGQPLTHPVSIDVQDELQFDSVRSRLCQSRQRGVLSEETGCTRVT